MRMTGILADHVWADVGVDPGFVRRLEGQRDLPGDPQRDSYGADCRDIVTAPPGRRAQA
jgi:hypothetical protein